MRNKLVKFLCCIFICIIISISFCANTYTFNSDIEISADINSIDIPLPEYAAEGVLYTDLAKAYGCNENLKFIVSPKTEADYWNNLDYIFLTGQWQYIDDIFEPENHPCYKWISTNLWNDPVFNSLQWQRGIPNPALYGYFMNTGPLIACCDDNNNYYLATNGLTDPQLSGELIKEQLITCYKEAKRIQATLYNTNIITKDSTDFEKASAYAQWFFKQNFFTTPAERGEYNHKSLVGMLESSVYTLLIDHHGTCGSKAALFNLFMNIEGITARGVHCGNADNYRTGHSVCWCLLDNKEYVFEYNKKEGLMPVDNKNEAIAHGKTTTHYIHEYSYNEALRTSGLPYNENVQKITY